ncbi:MULTISPECIES: 1-hydroxy-2-methyl-2-butenyl 4-diphosphate reductase [Streptomyces]|uniref:1-hydroxy-2-methyl-2-butenyl 4-diphosphate reductase n=1 Tax=Streptomyces lycii TaxID=2654337 RepID=A0ABQ7FRC0_9ACTN|nr:MULTISPECIES: 1-hydroxy-2-methyl-2-butenyl 4-diphosphate reductase [Streptomyces]KAF4410683.1 1-hydroxy-2-methyl-2-butenyl 4-diphosphate reductase [Streptomyces lycii]PGH47648.1 1-hydroxy-2-methyl-2-butenyl 4-diphosphate reductase [Streptomyces sp. Ru87]
MAPGEPPDTLLLVCALGVEKLALRGGGRAHAPTVLRTGMGPRAVERVLPAALGTVTPNAAVVATGFCAGLAPGMRPGDLVVADETRVRPGGPDRTPCTGTAALAAALAEAVRDRPGTTVHTGPVVGSDHLVRGAERALLHATGAVAADMESATVLRRAAAAGPRAVAAVRVVVDTPEHELVRVGTLSGGISAFRVLCAVPPALRRWHRSLSLPRR